MKRMPEADDVDYSAFGRLRRNIHRVQRRRDVWLSVTIAAIPIWFVAAWSAATRTMLAS